MSQVMTNHTTTRSILTLAPAKPSRLAPAPAAASMSRWIRAIRRELELATTLDQIALRELSWHCGGRPVARRAA